MSTSMSTVLGTDEKVAVPDTDGVSEPCEEIVMSKKQRKRLLKSQRFKETKSHFRAEQRVKEKEKKRKRKLEGQLPVVTKRRRMSDDHASNVKIVIDLSYEELMTDKDIKMLLKQCKRCYSENRKAEKPVQFYLTSFDGKCKEKMDQLQPGYKNWDVNILQEHYIDHFGKDNVVFLAAESPNILNELDSSKAYIIGGLVDHNHCKGYCYNKAVELGIQHAQLPIGNFVTISGRKVLAVNHVFEILLWYVQTGNWKEAFEKVIPLRKIDKTELTGESAGMGQRNDWESNKQGPEKFEFGTSVTDELGTSEKVETNEQGINEQIICEHSNDYAP